VKRDELITALGLPAGTRVDQRVPKKLLVENGAPTSADKRRINEGIEDLHWIAALKPATVGVPAFESPERQYLEIAVLSAVLRPGAAGGRLNELIHRAVPYPVVLVSELGGQLAVSLGHKRRSMAESEAFVLDGDLAAVEVDGSSEAAAFLAALALDRQPRSDLFVLYQAWIDAVLALLAARVTGAFTAAASPERAEARRASLAEIDHLEAEIARLRAAAAKEAQIARRVELNLELKRLQARYDAARSQL
jgi:hypothetical protein